MNGDEMCPTCGAECEWEYFEEDTKLYVCQRCGTYVFVGWAGDRYTRTPALVEKCREFDAFVEATVSGPSVDHWRQFGIPDCIKPKENQ